MVNNAALKSMIILLAVNWSVLHLLLEFVELPFVVSPVFLILSIESIVPISMLLQMVHLSMARDELF